MSLKTTIDFINLWDYLCNFVRETCKDRDESHGYKHMVNVTKNALYIYYRKILIIKK